MLISADDPIAVRSQTRRILGSADPYDSANIRFPWYLPETHFCVVRTISFRDSCLVTGLVTVDGNRMAREAGLLARDEFRVECLNR